ncbi:hypothetical protein UFOVP53_213 [uncultured Caudovirales phage]|uniref:Uncharacterized protein n=1 Tax=uncultured Caudovirales phage TaxID=2100421 RepID=A0A6J5KXE1_9CAUD|nr:hypothetical protein UFOVP53_213 [uncultured Caudovirales phage]
MNKQDLRSKIKEMENKNREESAPAVASKALVSFDSWFHQRKDKIARCHHKEIIAADFKARGVKDEASVEDFDKALELYGIKL